MDFLGADWQSFPDIESMMSFSTNTPWMVIPTWWVHVHGNTFLFSYLCKMRPLCLKIRADCCWWWWYLITLFHMGYFKDSHQMDIKICYTFYNNTLHTGMCMAESIEIKRKLFLIKQSLFSATSCLVWQQFVKVGCKDGTFKFPAKNTLSFVRPIMETGLGAKLLGNYCWISVVWWCMSTSLM